MKISGLNELSPLARQTLTREWFDQDEEEWVNLLKEKAGLLLEVENKGVCWNPRDYTLISAPYSHKDE